MKFILKHKILFYLIQFTWGSIMNTIGCFVALFMILTKHEINFIGPSIYFRCKKKDNFGGVEFGSFFIIGKTGDSSILHECGHGIQNCIWGPLMPFVISIPSAIRFWFRNIKYHYRHITPPTKYDDIWFEGQATKFGKKYYSIYKK